MEYGTSVTWQNGWAEWPERRRRSSLQVATQLTLVATAQGLRAWGIAGASWWVSEFT